MRIRPRRLTLISVAAALAAATPAAAAPALSGEWRMNEGAGTVVLDSAGDNHGTIITEDGGAPTYVPGVEGTALRFSGRGYVRLPDSALFESPRLSVEAWVRRDTSPGAYRYVISKGGRTCDTSSYGLYTGPVGGLSFYVLGPAGYVRSPAALPQSVWDGRWHQVVGVYDGERVRFYLDGAELGSGTAGPDQIVFGLPSRSPFVGAYGGSCELPFDGELDVLRLYTIPLTSQALMGSLASPAKRPAVATPGGRRPGASGSCVSVLPAKVALRKGRRASIRVTLRRGRAAVARRKVVLSGGGLKANTRTTDSKGRARFVVRPRRTTTMRIRPVGQPSRCKSVTLRVRR